MWFIIAVLIILFVCFVILVLRTEKKDKERAAKVTSERKMSLEKFKESKAAYVGGHPDADDYFKDVAFYEHEDMVEFYAVVCGYGYDGKPPKFKIDKKAVKNITLENATTMEKKVTLGRVLLAGVFALAWQKKKKNELAFVVIEWNDGQFDHETTFSFEEKDAVQEANRFRNDLIAAFRKSTPKTMSD